MITASVVVDRHRGAALAQEPDAQRRLLEAHHAREPRPDVGRVDRRGAVGVLVERLLPADPARQLRLGHLHEGGGARLDRRPRRPGRHDLEHALAVDAGPARAAHVAALLRRRRRAARRDDRLGRRDARRARDRRRLVQRQLGRERDRRAEPTCARALGRGRSLSRRSRCRPPRWAAGSPAQRAVQRRERRRSRAGTRCAGPRCTRSTRPSSRRRASSPASARTPPSSGRSRSSDVAAEGTSVYPHGHAGARHGRRERRHARGDLPQGRGEARLSLAEVDSLWVLVQGPLGADLYTPERVQRPTRPASARRRRGRYPRGRMRTLSAMLVAAALLLVGAAPASAVTGGFGVAQALQGLRAPGLVRRRTTGRASTSRARPSSARSRRRRAAVEGDDAARRSSSCPSPASSRRAARCSRRTR